MALADVTISEVMANTASGFNDSDEYIELCNGGTSDVDIAGYVINDGDDIVIEPFRAKAFPVIKDLVVDRSAFDRIVQAGGFITARTGSAPDANSIPVAKVNADRAFDAAECIGCGACVASCPNAAAMLFTGAKVTHLGLLPQGQPERFIRVDKMVNQMDSEDFGHCTNFGECTLACPKSISLDVISQMNGDYVKAQFKSRET